MQSNSDSLPGEVNTTKGKVVSGVLRTHRLSLALYPPQWPDRAVLSWSRASLWSALCMSGSSYLRERASQALCLGEGNQVQAAFLFVSLAQQQVGNGTFVRSWMHRWSPWCVCGNTNTRAPCGGPSTQCRAEAGGAAGLSEPSLPRLATDFALFWKILDL